MLPKNPIHRPGRIFYFHLNNRGAMYRAITLFCIRHGIHPDRRLDVLKALNGITLDLIPDHNLQVFLNGENVSEAIRKPEVSEWVSEISVIPEVRKKMVAQQRTFGEQKSLVMDGRDIGTVARCANTS